MLLLSVCRALGLLLAGGMTYRRKGAHLYVCRSVCAGLLTPSDLRTQHKGVVVTQGGLWVAGWAGAVHMGGGVEGLGAGALRALSGFGVVVDACRSGCIRCLLLVGTARARL